MIQKLAMQTSHHQTHMRCSSKGIQSHLCSLLLEETLGHWGSNLGPPETAKNIERQKDGVLSNGSGSASAGTVQQSLERTTHVFGGQLMVWMVCPMQVTPRMLVRTTKCGASTACFNNLTA
eukprot:6460211-Amphidinium_carterae.1